MTSTERPVIDFDHHSVDYRERWPEIYADLRERCPMGFSEAHGGFWVPSTMEALREITADDERFSSAHDLDRTSHGYEGVNIPELPASPIPIEMDPPEFHAYRRVFNPPFAPGPISTWEPFVVDATTACIDAVIEQGHMELVADLANPVPAISTLEMVGLPLADWALYAHPFHQIVSAERGSGDYEEAVLGVFWIIEQVEHAVAAARRDGVEGRTDILAYLCQAEIDDAPIPDANVVSMILLMFAGGFDTTTSLFGNAVRWLSSHPVERQRLVDEPELLDSATEEFLRYFSPQQALARTATTETEILGQRLQPGDRVLLPWAAANRDPAVFENPDEIVLDRFPNRHCAFGLGIHRCLGSNFARIEFKVMLREVLRRMPDLVIDETGVVPYPSIGITNGYSTLPARFTPGPVEGSNLPAHIVKEHKHV